jgi:hypothetical protein
MVEIRGWLLSVAVRGMLVAVSAGFRFLSCTGAQCMAAIRSSVRIGLVGLAFATLCGCVREEVEGSTHVYRNELWVPFTVLLGGVAAAGVGWFLKKSSARYGWTLLILGPLAALLLAPSLFLDRGTVNDTGFVLRTGILGMTAVHDVKFDDLQMVRITREESRGRRGSKRTNYYMVCERKDGSSAKVPLGNDVAEAAALRFLHVLDEREIPVINQTGE